MLAQSKIGMPYQVFVDHICLVVHHVCLVHHICLSSVCFFATPWTVAHQTLLSMGFFRQENWSGLPCPPSRHIPDPGIEPTSLTSPALAGGFLIISTTWEILYIIYNLLKK